MTLIKVRDKKAARIYSKEWAQSIINNPDIYYLDIETNTLPKKDEAVDIIQLGITDNNENIIINTLLRSKNPIDPKAEATHHIGWNDCRSSTLYFQDLLPILYEIFKHKHIICYNAEFDIGQIEKNIIALGYQPPKINYDCAMLYYAAYCGLWDEKRSQWKWQKLPNFSDGSSHISINDTISTKRLIEF
ncbi:MAG: 3'-5' exonuclease, partial [Nitrososphaeraceae archaeon]|nr:3'-5' exonuclease [Nitrososphaeraceae archaeon]